MLPDSPKICPSCDTLNPDVRDALWTISREYRSPDRWIKGREVSPRYEDEPDLIKPGTLIGSWPLDGRDHDPKPFVGFYKSRGLLKLLFWRPKNGELTHTFQITEASRPFGHGLSDGYESAVFVIELTKGPVIR